MSDTLAFLARGERLVVVPDAPEGRAVRPPRLGHQKRRAPLRALLHGRIGGGVCLSEAAERGVRPGFGEIETRIVSRRVREFPQRGQRGQRILRIAR